MLYIHDMGYTDGNVNTEYGSKAGNLGRLWFEGFRVPNGAVLRPADDLPQASLDNVLRWVGEYGPSTGTTTWAVRSSGLAEDGDDSSYAGQHDTFLHVETEDVMARIAECRASGSKAEAYREAKGEEDKGIAVLIQQMVPAYIAGVTFTSDPFSMELGTSVIEYTLGLGDKLVAGEVNPEGSYEVDNTTNTFTPSLGSMSLSRTTSALVAVHKQCQRVAESFGIPMDIEWAVDDEGIVWILQARPITTGGRIWNYPEFIGRSVVKGRAEGLAVWAKASEPLNTRFDEGNILLAVMTDPHMVPLMMKSSGIATQIGGRTCHAAIVSRELNKPCVVGIGNLSTLQSRTQIVLDATEGKVIV
jgi:pyruvate,water dikinase